MRVSVVATGIDAVDVNADLPVPRRSMNAPLKQKVAAEERPAPLTLEQPAAAAAPAPVAEAAEEPTLFEGMEVEPLEVAQLIVDYACAAQAKAFENS